VCEELKCLQPDGTEEGELLRPYEGTPCGPGQVHTGFDNNNNNNNNN